MWTDRESFQKIAKGHSETSLFHVLAAPVFSGLRLRLANNPYQRSGRYGFCSALYELSGGPSLCVEMEPLDSNALTVTFGRKWFFNGEFVTLSNHYFVFARQVGIDLPKFYELGFQEQLIRPFRAVIKDIERSWATVIEGLSSSAIEQAERSEFGAIQILDGRRETDPTGVVIVEDLDATKKS
jgi:hypothetical protein